MQGDETMVPAWCGATPAWPWSAACSGEEESQLRTWLCSRKVVTTRETFTKPKYAVEANRAKDHFLLAKSVQWRS